MNQYIKRNLYSLLLFIVSLSPLFTFHFSQNQLRPSLETDWFYSVEIEKESQSQYQVPPTTYPGWIEEIPYKLKAHIKTPRGQLEFFILFCFICCMMQSFLGFMIPRELSNRLKIKKDALKKRFFQQFFPHLSKNSSLLFQPHDPFPILNLPPLPERDLLKVGDHLYEVALLRRFKRRKNSSESNPKISLKKVLSEIQKTFSKELKDQNISFSIEGTDHLITGREGPAYYIFYVIFKNILKRTLPNARITIHLTKVKDFFSLTIIDTGLVFSEESLRYLNSLTGRKPTDDFLEKAQKNIRHVTEKLGWKISYGTQNNLSITKILMKETL